MIIGIDPGLKGGLCAMHRNSSQIWDMVVMPETILETIDWLKQVRRQAESNLQEVHVYLEKAQVMAIAGKAKPGLVPTFNYAMKFGELLGAIRALRLAHTLITPNQWTRQMHVGCKGKTEGKERSIEAARNLWPSVSFLTSQRSKNPHDGLIEAALIAEYGRRQMMGSAA